MVFGGRSAVPLLHEDREENLVREIALFRTREGQAEAFVEAYGGVANILNEAVGSRDASLRRGVEDPDSFILSLEWESVDANTALTQKPQFEARHVEAVA